MTNSIDDNNYNPISVEKAIDDGYTQAENLGEYQEPVEEALEKIEALPYAIHGEQDYGKQEVAQTLRGIAQLGEVSHQPTLDTMGDGLAVGIEVMSHDDDSIEGIMSLSDSLDNMEEVDRMDQAHEYTQIIDQIGESVVKNVYGPVLSLASEGSNQGYKDVDVEEMVEQVAGQTGVEIETFEQAVKSVAQFKGELFPESETAV